MRRRAQALLLFVGYALQPLSAVSVSADSAFHDGASGDLLSLLIDIVTVRGPTAAHEKNAVDFAKAARFAMSQTLAAMSAADFLHAVLALLEHGDDHVSS
jgi:U3 small nucleolar RNA-associated protein 10